VCVVSRCRFKWWVDSGITSPMWFGGVSDLFEWWVGGGRDVALLFLFREGGNEGGILNGGSEELRESWDELGGLLMGPDCVYHV
jgi:hypothetical protein